MSQRNFFNQQRVYRCAPRRGMTLVEMLVAMALSLIIILAVTQVFRLVGDNVLASRAVTEMAGQLRSTSDQLRRDLSALTVPVRPWTDLSSGQGYFEIYEGPFWDLGIGDGAALAPGPTIPRGTPYFSETSAGDSDDVLMFTARAQGTPFSGQVLDFTVVPPTPITQQSNIAEIAWFTRFDNSRDNSPEPPQPEPGEVTLHRRVFLVLPQLNITDPTDGLPIIGLPGTHSGTAATMVPTPEEFFQTFDISVGYRPRFDATGTTIVEWVRFANSLENLSLRENRTAHRIDLPVGVPATQANLLFPFNLSRSFLRPKGTALSQGIDGAWGVANVDDNGIGGIDDPSEAGTYGSDDRDQPIAGVLGESYGSDVILSQLLAFDVKVFDPSVAIRTIAAAPETDALLPGDPGYRLTNTNIGQGGYVDLFYSRYTTAPASTFSGPPLALSGFPRYPEITWGFSSVPAVYDTWSLFYEHDGGDQFDDGFVDLGTDGVDNDNANGVDDIGERETSPPYPVPLRGIQVRIRIIDPDSRQVRQVTVSSDFVPE